MAETQRLEDFDIPAVNDTSRISRLDVPAVESNDKIVAVAEGARYRGSVTRVDRYGETTDVERVVEFRLSDGHQPEEGWELWKAYVVEEPAGIYRVTALENQLDGPGKRSIHLDAPSEIVVEQAARIH